MVQKTGETSVLGATAAVSMSASNDESTRPIVPSLRESVAGSYAMSPAIKASELTGLTAEMTAGALLGFDLIRESGGVAFLVSSRETIGFGYEQSIRVSLITLRL